MSSNTYDVAGQRNQTILLVRRIIAYTVLIVLTILSLFPFIILIINSTRSHYDIMQGFSLIPGTTFGQNLTNVLKNEQLPIFRGMLNSFIVAGGSALLSVYFSTFTAYGIHVYDFRLKKFAFTFIMIIMMVPTQVSALGFIKLMRSFNMLDTFWPLVIPSIAAPAVFFFMKQYMESSLPLEIVEAARIDGCNEFRIFNEIILPIMKPAIAVQAIFTFVTGWNNYFTPALILSKKNMKTLPILIAELRSADFLKFDMGQVYFLIMLSILPVIVVYLCLSKFIIRGVTLGSVKG
ncbi:MAG: carbohydrate ABC transporter permease [Oscillospiraceae bacterium]|nr:carbohydrate ABC transporter permease [Oscillospiraceae bacterium]